ncbi:hypothetical protein IMY05_008G0089000 [Salix suchowensis]|nr:hypothetical protein IMY05_008G0089000 [Salix suchowensis]
MSFFVTIDLYKGAREIGFRPATEPHPLFVIRDGQVKESHSTQPVPQSSPEWHQETQEASPHLHERDGPQVFEEPEICKEA